MLVNALALPALAGHLAAAGFGASYLPFSRRWPGSLLQPRSLSHASYVFAVGGVALCDGVLSRLDAVIMGIEKKPPGTGPRRL
ncbi:MAG TPA: hypothetical protein VJ045_10275 [Hyphomicrobiaceae bacterium]|nr:hypothetical protein [Hyphomicrobiaceae bacterium]